MKKLLLTSLLALSALFATAQEATYNLPSTSFLVDVQVQQTQYFAGPYARFAARMLNMEVPQRDSLSCRVIDLSLRTALEADYSTWFTCNPASTASLALTAQGLISLGPNVLASTASWRYPTPGSADFSGKGLTGPTKTVVNISHKQVISEEGDTLMVPVENRMLVDKTLEDKASEAAEMLLSIRQSRHDIATGNTDANYAGEALGEALKELDRLEEEYLALFRGYSVNTPVTYTFEVVPDASGKTLRYPLFRLTDKGPVSLGSRGVPYYLVLAPEPLKMPDDDRRKGRGPVLHYRIPAICLVSITRDGSTLLETRVPVYQLGVECTYPATN